MALKIELKPKRNLRGDCVITNAGPRTHLQVEGHVRILREKDIMTLPQADSLAKLIYLAIQFIYTANNPKDITNSISGCRSNSSSSRRGPSRRSRT